MKGEYVEDRGEHHHHDHHIFSKFPTPHLQTQNQNPPKFPPTHFPPHPFPLAVAKDSEEADSATTVLTLPASKKPKTAVATTSEDGATVEVVRRPRGRPPGSKNKPKPPVFLTREPEPIMAPYILEIPGGSDIIDSLARFTRRRGLGICVLAASGAVSNVSLKQPSTAAPGGTVTFHGRFDILSLSAVLLLQTIPFCGNINSRFAFTISLAGPQGQIVGGKVVGSLIAAGTVYVVAASFNSPSYHRLPLEEQEVQNPSAGGGDARSNSPVSGGGDGGGGNSGGAMGMYSCRMGSATSDVIWAPAVRPPPPPPPY